jgi:phosphatidylinositol 3-kinase
VFSYSQGGENGKDFETFKQLCVEAYNTLRKNANLILNLIHLMEDANIPDIANERCLLQVQDRFQLELNDEEAGESFQKLMQESVTALFPRLSEKIHKWKQYWDNR